MKIRCLIVPVLVICFPYLASAQGSVSQEDASSFRWGQVIVPGVLLTAGALGVGDGWFRDRINEPVRDYAAGLRGNRYVTVDNYIQYVPGVSIAALELFRKPEHTIQERLCLSATAFLSEALLVNGIKYTVREMRPDLTSRNSFPSGHTATAFTGAEIVRREYGWGYGAAAYAVATATALLRVYNERHWVNDLLAGAAVGILSANIAYWLLPFERKVFRLQDGTPAAAALPLATPAGYGFAFSIVF